MEPNQVNDTGQIPTESSDTSSNKSIGPAIGIIIIIALLVIGSLYFWGQNINKNQVNSNAIEEQVVAEQAITKSQLEIQATQNQSSSDDVSSIEADLNATNVDNLGTELDSAEAGLETQ